MAPQDAGHSARIGHSCPTCSRTFKRSGHLTTHLRTHTGERPYRCEHPGCDKTFARRDNLRRHAASHDVDAPRPFACAHAACGQAFTTRQRLARHVALHERPSPHKCTLCAAAFAKKKVLAQHYAQMHGGALPYCCAEQGCEAAFLRPSQLRRHTVQVHTVTTYVCMDARCRELAPFDKFSQLQRHLRRAHRRVPQCGECGRRFGRTRELRLHEETHTAPAIDRLHFHCPYDGCSAAYTKKTNLQMHVRSKHTEVDANVCDVCEATFTLRSSLRRHVLKVHASATHRDKADRRVVVLDDDESQDGDDDGDDTDDDFYDGNNSDDDDDDDDRQGNADDETPNAGDEDNEYGAGTRPECSIIPVEQVEEPAAKRARLAASQ